MDRLQNTDLSATPPAATTGTTGYPRVSVPGGVDASNMHPYYLYMLIEEIRAVLIEAGLTPAYATLDQLKTAITTLIANATPAASDTVAGLAERATSAEVVTGTDDVRFATPAGVAAAILAAITEDSLISTYEALVTAIAASAYGDSDAAMDALAAITGLSVFTAGDTVHLQHLGEELIYCASATYTANSAFTFTSPRTGTFRFNYDYEAPGNQDSGFYARIYVNNVAVGTAQTCTNDAYTAATSQDLPISAGDLVELRTRWYADATGAAVNHIKNYKISAAEALPGNAVIDF